MRRHEVALSLQSLAGSRRAVVVAALSDAFRIEKNSEIFYNVSEWPFRYPGNRPDSFDTVRTRGLGNMPNTV